MKISQAIIATLAFLAVIALVVGNLYPKLLTGDWVEVTIDNVTVDAKGHVDVSLSMRASSGTQIITAGYDGARYLGGGGSKSGGLFGRPGPVGTEGFDFELDPEQYHQHAAFPADWEKRLLVHAGETRTLRGGERLYFCDFTTTDHSRYDCYVEAGRTTRSP